MHARMDALTDNPRSECLQQLIVGEGNEKLFIAVDKKHRRYPLEGCSIDCSGSIHADGIRYSCWVVVDRCDNTDSHTAGNDEQRSTDDTNHSVPTPRTRLSRLIKSNIYTVITHYRTDADFMGLDHPQYLGPRAHTVYGPPQ